MIFGFDSFARFPFATVGDDNNVNITVTGNTLVVSIGPIGIATTSIIQQSGADPLILGTGTLTISGTSETGATGSPLIMANGTAIASGTAVADVTGNPLTMSTGTVTIVGTADVIINGTPITLNTKQPGIITWNEIIPGATMVWTPIKPY